MPAVSGGYAREAEQSIGERLTVRQDVRLGIAGNLGLPEGLNSTQIRFHRPAVLRRLNGHDERDIVLGPATALARPLSAQVGIIEFDALRQRLMALVFQHRLHELVFEPPGSVVLHAQLARELQCRGALLALGEQVDGQEPRAQGQLGAVEERACSERGLVMALVALIYAALLNLTAGGIPAVRADVSTWPAQLIQRLTALLLVAIAIEKFMQTQTFLELNRILCHAGILFIFKQFQCPRPSDSLAEP